MEVKDLQRTEHHTSCRVTFCMDRTDGLRASLQPICLDRSSQRHSESRRSRCFRGWWQPNGPHLSSLLSEKADWLIPIVQLLVVSPAEAINPDLRPLLTLGEGAPHGLQILEVQPHRVPYSSPLHRTAGVHVAEALPLDLGDGQFATVADEECNVWARHMSTGRNGHIYYRCTSKMQF